MRQFWAWALRRDRYSSKICRRGFAAQSGVSVRQRGRRGITAGAVAAISALPSTLALQAPLFGQACSLSSTPAASSPPPSPHPAQPAAALPKFLSLSLPQAPPAPPAPRPGWAPPSPVLPQATRPAVLRRAAPPRLRPMAGVWP